MTGPDTLMRDVRMFDRERVTGADRVLVHQGRIAEVGFDLRARPETLVVDGCEGAPLPGLIDADKRFPRCGALTLRRWNLAALSGSKGLWKRAWGK